MADRDRESDGVLEAVCVTVGVGVGDLENDSESVAERKGLCDTEGDSVGVKVTVGERVKDLDSENVRVTDVDAVIVTEREGVNVVVLVREVEPVTDRDAEIDEEGVSVRVAVASGV